MKLEIRNWKLEIGLMFLFSIFYFLFSVQPTLAGSCSRGGTDGTSACYLECRNARSQSECGGSTPSWNDYDCSAGRRCAQGTFLGPIVGTPGTSCYQIQNQQEQLECRKAICGCLNRDEQGNCPAASQGVCSFGVCIYGNENASAAQAAQAAASGALPCNYTLDDIVQTGVNFANILFGITGSLMLVFILYGGYQFFTSMGNAEHIQKAKQTLTMAFIGFIIVVGASLFVRFAGDLIGASFKGGPGGALGETVIPPPQR
ncbi:hypothetical protein HY477_04015 [Candidatus Uhrbacteria bacterium]|nr:hypothetical protein [Candidatus Uhrbacteria bacterium]